MARSDVLVSADWAEQNLNAPKTVFVEVDEDTSRLRRRPHRRRRPARLAEGPAGQRPSRLPRTSEQFSDLLSAKGVANDDTVVLYGGNNNWFAAYAYWYFKLYGHQDVKLIDGGRKKWELDGRPAVQGRPSPARPPSTRPTAPDLSIRAFRDEVIDAIGSKNLVDVRSPDEFSGKILAPAHLPQEQAQQRGHVPGAINIPWSTTANEDGTFKSDDDLAKLYAEKGYDESKDTIAYCRIGERSSHTWFVLQGDPRQVRCQELRRQLGRIRLARRRTDRVGGSLSHVWSTCTGPDPARGRRRREGNGHHRPRSRR